MLKHQTDGRFDLEAVKVLREHRVRLLCLGHVNNETGVVQDIPAIAAALREGSPQTQLFVDGVQAAGKWDYTPGFWEGVAGYSLSAHKFNGPKGIGLLIYESRLNPRPQIHGGRQQYGVRSGTLPVPLIVGLAKALEVSTSRGAKVRAQLQALRRRLVDGLREMQRNDPHFKLTFNSLPDAEATHQSPAIVNFSFPPVEGEVILHHLEKNEIFVGLGSACSAYSKEPSRILRGIGRTVEEALCSLRVSFDGNNTLQDVDAFLQEFRQAYTALYPVYHRKAAHP
ncbi:MAG: cysteine desulfurase family protein [Nitrospinaceae bacterium]